MEDMMFNENGTREEIHRKLRTFFDGKIVRKDLTKRIKEGANVPVYVLEFLLGQYCSSDDEEIVKNLKNGADEFILNKFNWNDVANSTYDLYKKVLTK